MSVSINKTDGTELLSITDGNANVNQFALAFIGRLYRNYGELVNENFVKLLENFANSSAPPGTPLVGQLWYDTTNEVLNLYRADGYIGLAVLTTSASVPNMPRTGDLWYDSFNEQLKMYNGSNWLVVTPQYSMSQNKSGVFVESVRDTLGNLHVCVITYQSNSVIALQCKDPEWIPEIAFSGLLTIKPGFNLAYAESQKFIGTATNSENLDGVPAASYLRNDMNGTIDGSLTLTGGGLNIGELEDFQFYIDSNQSYISRADGAINLTIGPETILSVGESYQVLTTDGTQENPAIGFISDTNTGMYKVDENIIGFSVAGNTILEVSPDGLFINGNVQATSYTGTLNAANISSTNITTTNLSVLNTALINSLQVTTNTVLGSSIGSSVQFRGSTISIPNGLNFSSANVTFNGIVKFASYITTANGTDPVLINSGLEVNDNTTVNGELNVNGDIYTDTLNVNEILLADINGRLRLNSTVATGYANLGDFSMGSTNGIRAYNTPKMWIAYNGTLSGLAVYDSFNIDYVTRTSSNHYTFTTENPITSGAIAVVGSNGTQLVANPSIGAITFSITTTSENAQMALVVLGQ